MKKEEVLCKLSSSLHEEIKISVGDLFSLLLEIPIRPSF